MMYVCAILKPVAIRRYYGKSMGFESKFIYYFRGTKFEKNQKVEKC